MRKRIMGLAAAAAIFGTSSPVAAQNDLDIWSGNGFLRTCSETISNKTALTLGMCIGYIDGWMARDRIPVEGNVRIVCKPIGVTNGQALDIVLKHLRENPQYRHEHIDLHLYQSLGAAFPCPKPGNQ